MLAKNKVSKVILKVIVIKKLIGKVVIKKLVKLKVQFPCGKKISWNKLNIKLKFIKIKSKNKLNTLKVEIAPILSSLAKYFLFS